VGFGAERVSFPFLSHIILLLLYTKSIYYAESSVLIAACKSAMEDLVPSSCVHSSSRCPCTAFDNSCSWSILVGIQYKYGSSTTLPSFVSPVTFFVFLTGCRSFDDLGGTSWAHQCCSF
jgi:hypothetical protein